MHACGHDTHVAMLMGVAEIVTRMKAQLAGTVVFVFQPAEEGPPGDEEGGAPLMIKEGLLTDPKMEVMFGLHISSQTEVGKIKYRAGGMMAASDWFYITVHGKQAHGSAPWSGVDPIVVSAEIIQGLQTIVSRQVDLTEFPAVVTVGKIESGVRANIIPEVAEMVGTIRTLDTAMQRQIHQKVVLTSQKIAESAGARAEVRISGKRRLRTTTRRSPTGRWLPCAKRPVPPTWWKVKPAPGPKTLDSLPSKFPASISSWVECPKAETKKRQPRTTRPIFTSTKAA